MKHVIILCLFLIGLSGCVTNSSKLSQETISEISIPNAWQNDADGNEVSADWIHDFNSSELEALIEIALKNNLALQAGEFQTKAAVAAARISKSALYPNLGIGLNSGKQQTRFSGLNFQKIETDVHSLSLSSQWEVDLWGRLGRNASAARAQADAALADYSAARLSLIALTSKSYFNAIAATKQLELAEENLRLLEKRFATVSGRFDRGVADSSEYRAAEAQVSAAAATFESRAIEYDSAIRTLETVLGEYPNGSRKLTANLPQIGTEVPAGLPSELLTRRPDLVAEERRLAAELLNNKSVQRNWLPRLALTSSLGTTSDQLSDLLNQDFSVWSVFGDLAAPLLAGGRLSAERNQANAIAEASVRQYKDTVLTAFREVESALSSNKRYRYLETQQRRAADSFALSEERIESLYKKGAVDLFALVDARTRTLDAQIQLIDIANRRLQNRIDLFVALGGGFE